MNRSGSNTWTARTLVNQMRKGKVNFDNAVQRNLVWGADRKSLLIHSMAYGYAIPGMYFIKGEDGIYDSLDGKQRSNTIYEYLNDEFALTEVPPVINEEGKPEDISGLCFSQLPEWAQDVIRDCNLTIVYFEGMTDQEVKEFFRRINNGKPLSAIELTRANAPALETFQQIAAHEAIQFVVSEAGKNRFTDEMIAMQVYHLITEENPDFTTKAIRDWVRTVEIDNDVLAGINAGLDAYLTFAKGLEYEGSNKVLRTVKARTHFISCAYYCYLAVRAGQSNRQIYEVLKPFFSGSPTQSAVYNRTVAAGSAKPSAVQTRRDVIKALLPVEAKAADEEETAVAPEAEGEPEELEAMQSDPLAPEPELTEGQEPEVEPEEYPSDGELLAEYDPEVIPGEESCSEEPEYDWSYEKVGEKNFSGGNNDNSEGTGR